MRQQLDGNLGYRFLVNWQSPKTRRNLKGITDYHHLVNSAASQDRRVYQMMIISVNREVPSGVWRLPVYQQVITRVSV